MRILAISPHFDDVPLSLGQSLADGWLRHHDVTVGVVFGRTNWVRWFYPTPKRAPLAHAIRRTEELVNARRFHYALRVGDRSEAILRLGSGDSSVFLDPTFDPDSAAELEPVIRLMQRWSSDFDATLVPLGIGDHIDHQLCRAAGQHLAEAGFTTGYYEDRPYACALSDQQLADAASEVGLAQSVELSGPIDAKKTRRIWYPSQFDEYFLTAMKMDVDARRHERIWCDDPSPWR